MFSRSGLRPAFLMQWRAWRRKPHPVFLAPHEEVGGRMAGFPQSAQFLIDCLDAVGAGASFRSFDAAGFPWMKISTLVGPFLAPARIFDQGRLASAVMSEHAENLAGIRASGSPSVRACRPPKCLEMARISTSGVGWDVHVSIYPA